MLRVFQKVFSVTSVVIIWLSAAAMAQDAKQNLQEVFNRVSNNPGAQAAKKEWQSAPVHEVECVATVIRVQSGSTLEDLINKGVRPSHDALGQAFQVCREINAKFPISTDQPCVLNDAFGTPVNTRCDSAFFQDQGGTPSQISREQAYRMLFSGQGAAVKHGQVENEGAKQARLQAAQSSVTEAEPTSSITANTIQAETSGADTSGTVANDASDDVQTATTEMSALSSASTKNDPLIFIKPNGDTAPREEIFFYGNELAHFAAKLHHCKPDKAKPYRDKYLEQVRRLFAEKEAEIMKRYDEDFQFHLSGRVKCFEKFINDKILGANKRLDILASFELMSAKEIQQARKETLENDQMDKIQADEKKKNAEQPKSKARKENIEKTGELGEKELTEAFINSVIRSVRFTERHSKNSVATMNFMTGKPANIMTVEWAKAHSCSKNNNNTYNCIFSMKYYTTMPGQNDILTKMMLEEINSQSTMEHQEDVFAYEAKGPHGANGWYSPTMVERMKEGFQEQTRKGIEEAQQKPASTDPCDDPIIGGLSDACGFK